MKRAATSRGLHLCSVVGLACSLALGARGVEAQTLRGKIVDSDTGEPVMLAYVALLVEGHDMVVAGLANTEGDFALDAPEAGSYFVYVSRSGYETLMDGVFEMGEGGEFDVRIGLKPRPIELQPVTVEAQGNFNYLEEQGFYERAIASRGTFLIREDIERLATHRLTDALRNIPLLEVDASIPLVGGAGSLENPRLLVHRPDRQSNVCSPTLYIDRHVIASGLGGAVRPDDYINPNDVDAIEVYTRSSEVPVGFDEISDCGVILVWTRKR